MLRTIDYVSVFLLIAGTVTPLVLVNYRNVFGWAVFGTVWAIAIFGIIIRSYHTQLPKHITNTLYIVLGWIPTVLVFDTPKLPLMALCLLAVGGIFYSIGFIIYVIEKPNPKPGVFGFHEIWHGLVAIAAIFHYFLMYFYILK
jgi:hemolysin III